MDYIQKILGGSGASPSPSPVSNPNADGFADFAGAPNPLPPSHTSSLAGSVPSPAATAGPTLPYTKWYRVWERSSLSDFYNEFIILPFILIVVFTHLWGTKTNRSKARNWAKAHAPVLRQEFAKVGFGKGNEEGDEDILRENGPAEFISYATGRANVAFLDVKLTLVKRFNPLVILGENILGFFFESMPPTQEQLEATVYAFDGREKDLVPSRAGESVKAGGQSTYDGFVWAVVSKDVMKSLRDERYDVSLTTTKEHPKLPASTSVMSESNEVTEALLTAELVKAVEEAGDDFVALIVSDQPTDKPKTLNETVPRKRIQLITKLSSASTSPTPTTLSLFKVFLRLPDQLASNAHFRPEVLRRIKATREDEIRKIKKVSEDEEAEVRREKAEKDKKEKREGLLKGMSAKEQQKYLEREREKEMKRGQKRRTMKA